MPAHGSGPAGRPEDRLQRASTVPHMDSRFRGNDQGGSVIWPLRISSIAQRALRSIPARDRDRINEALNDMKADPFTGDIARMKRKYQGSFPASPDFPLAEPIGRMP